jgi:anti-sigma B factor antagonist
MDEETVDAKDLVLDVRQDGRAVIVSMNGELDAFTAPDLADVCQHAFDNGALEVVIDLTDTSFLDSSGLRALVGARQLFGAAGGSVRLSHPSEPVTRLLAITGLTAYIAIDDARR